MELPGSLENFSMIVFPSLITIESHRIKCTYQDNVLTISGSGVLQWNLTHERRIDRVIIQEGITDVKKTALPSSVRSLRLPDSITVFPYEAVRECDNLKKIEISNSTEVDLNRVSAFHKYRIVRRPSHFILDFFARLFHKQ